MFKEHSFYIFLTSFNIFFIVLFNNLNEKLIKISKLSEILNSTKRNNEIKQISPN